MKKLNILKIIDVWGWAYYFTGIEQQRYSRHNIILCCISDVPNKDYKALDNIDILYIPSPHCSFEIINKTIIEANKRGIKIIGGFSGGSPLKEYKIYSNSIDVVSTINIKNYSDLGKIYNTKKILFLPEGIDTNFFRPLIKKPNEFILGSVGSRTLHKRIELLDKLNIPIKQKKEVKDFKKERALFLMLEYYNSITSYIQLSYYEASPRPVMEAMSCELPVIATNSGSVPLMLDKKYIVPEFPENYTVDKARKLLEKIKNNKELREKIGKENRAKIIKSFGWENIQFIWDDIWESIAENNTSKAKEISNSYLNENFKSKIYSSFFEKFDYNKNTNKQLKELNELCLLFSNMNFPIYLTYGTLLGIVRNNDLIKKDDDIDISYISKKHTFKSVLDEFEYNIRPKLEERGYKIEYIKWSFGKDKKRLCMGQYHLIRNDVCLDLWVSWIDETKKLWFSPLCEGALTKKDLLPLKRIKFKQYYYYIPNKSKTLLQFLYGVNWKTPAQTKPNVNHFFFQRKITKVIDEFGWAYDFVTREQQKYSVHNLQIQRINDYNLKDNPDLVYLSSPGMSNEAANTIPIAAKSKKIIVIGGYSSDTNLKYTHADLIVTVSPRRRIDLKKLYPNKEVIFLPESVDTNFFCPVIRKHKEFIVGYAGRTHKVKRIHLFEKLDYPVKMKCNHAKEDFVKGKSLQPMLDFYHSIDCLILLSQSEAMSRVISEAMACGLPVISTDTGSASTILDKRWVITASSETEIIMETNRLLNVLKCDKKLRNKVGNRNRKFVTKYIDTEKNQKYWDETFSIMTNGRDSMEKRLEKVKEVEANYLRFLGNTLEIYNVKPEKETPEPIVITKPTKVETYKKTNNSKYAKIIKTLIDNGCKVCLMGETCYQVITKKPLNDKELHLGVDNLVEADKLVNSTKVKLYKLPNKMKNFGIFNLSVTVPFPVIAYLQRNGHPDILEELK